MNCLPSTELIEYLNVLVKLISSTPAQAFLIDKKFMCYVRGKHTLPQFVFVCADVNQCVKSHAIFENTEKCENSQLRFVDSITGFYIQSVLKYF